MLSHPHSYFFDSGHELGLNLARIIARFRSSTLKNNWTLQFGGNFMHFQSALFVVRLFSRAICVGLVFRQSFSQQHTHIGTYTHTATYIHTATHIHTAHTYTQHTHIHTATHIHPRSISSSALGQTPTNRRTRPTQQRIESVGSSEQTTNGALRLFYYTTDVSWNNWTLFFFMCHSCLGALIKWA